MTLNEQFELLDQLLESGEIKIIDDKLYAECDDLDELLEFVGPVFNKAKALRNAAVNTDENKQDVLNARANKAKDKLLNLAQKGKMKKVNKVLDKVQDSVRNVSDTAQRISTISTGANKAKSNLKAASDATKDLAASNNIVQKQEKPVKPVKAKGKPEAPANNASVKPFRGAGRPKGQKRQFTESLVLEMPENLIIFESNNYAFFLEQVLEYNGFKVNDDNVNVLAEALENGHAIIE